MKHSKYKKMQKLLCNDTFEMKEMQKLLCDETHEEAGYSVPN